MSECCAVNKPLPVAPSVMNCPVSGTRSKQVDLLTVKSLVRHLDFAMPATQYYFCASPGCDVVYFPSNPRAPAFSRDDLLVRAKESNEEATVCYCFGISRRHIREEVKAAGESSLAEKIKAEIQAGRCACEVKNPSGRCCLGDVLQAIKETDGSALRGVRSRPQISNLLPVSAEENI
jgi:bacterioferritin-associated ferredoxin